LAPIKPLPGSPMPQDELLAPEQEDFRSEPAKTWWKGTAWDFPKDAPSWWSEGIHWEEFQDAKPAMVYEPPQWTPQDEFKYWTQLCNWWTFRSPTCAETCIPCNGAKCVQCCCIPDSEKVHVDSPDEFLNKMCTVVHKNAPESLKGVWWMCDNNAASECLFTFAHADWADDKKTGVLRYYHNYGVPANCFGVMTLCGAGIIDSKLRVQISPNGKWISIYGGGAGWIYVDQPEDSFKCAGEYANELYGETLRPEPFEMLRVSHEDEKLPLSEPNYQYRLRRVAYVSDGNLVKTPAWEEFVKRAKLPYKPGSEPNCCGYTFCCRSKQALALGNFHQQNEYLFVRYAKPSASE